MSTPESTIPRNLQELRERIADAARTAGRTPEEITLLLATKTVEPERIRIALEAGETQIGENRVQELVAKADALADLPHTAHFIGHLQTNKINAVLRTADCIQSVDREALVDRLVPRLEGRDRPLDVFIQVNTSAEPSKFGVDPAEALVLVRRVAKEPTLHLRGFMTIGLFSSDEVAVRRSYAALRELRETVAREGIPGAEEAVELSMGMSGDLEWAIAEGATMVRVGTRIFGERPTSDADYWPPSLPR